MAQTRSNNRRDDLINLVVLSALWLIALLVVDPRGNFALNDDWVYGWPVNTLLESGRYEILSWTGVSLVGHVLWGTLFCSVFGFSFTVLRVSVLVLGLSGVLTTYYIFTSAGARRGLAFLAALIVGFNPLFYELSFTFMTDISFLAFVLVTLLCFMKYLEKGRLSFLFAATITAAFSTLIRDVGVLLPGVFGVVLLLKHGLNWRTLWRAVFPLAVAMAGYVLYRVIVAATIGSPTTYDAKVRAIINILEGGFTGVLLVLDRFQNITMYLGLFLAPFLLLRFEELWRGLDHRLKKWWWGVVICTAVIFVWRMLALGKIMPLSRNILFDFGLGPPTLRDVGVLHLPNYYSAPKVLWLAVTVIALAGACTALGFLAVETYRLIRRQAWKTQDPHGAQLAMVTGVVIGYVGLLCLSGLFDRYLIYPLPFCLLALYFWVPFQQRGPGKVTVAVSVVMILLTAVFAVGATHDYLAWNRSRWAALDYLTTERGISADRIDGGIEFNGWYLYDVNYVRQKDKSWWWVVDDEFVVSFGPLPGYHVEESFPYTKLMPPAEAAILALRRDEADTTSVSDAEVGE